MYNKYGKLRKMGLKFQAKMKFLGLKVGLKMGLNSQKFAANATNIKEIRALAVSFLSEHLSSFFFCFCFHNCQVQLVAAGN